MDAPSMLINDSDSTTTEEELRGELNVTANAKDTIPENMHKAIRPIRNIAEIQDKSTGKYNTFGFGNINELCVSELYRCQKG